jgi:hypothetical protein
MLKSKAANAGLFKIVGAADIEHLALSDAPSFCKSQTLGSEFLNSFSGNMAGCRACSKPSQRFAIFAQILDHPC